MELKRRSEVTGHTRLGSVVGRGTVGITAVLISGSLGVFLGLISAFQGGRLDALIMRIADVQLAFPFILLAIAVVAVVGGGLLNVILILGVTGWVSYGRVVRSQVLSVKEKEYVEAARALGSRALVLVFRHILPNVMTPVIVLATFNVASYMVAEASLTFLGLGVQPAIPSWGIMLADGREYMPAKRQARTREPLTAASPRSRPSALDRAPHRDRERPRACACRRSRAGASSKCRLART